VLDGKQPGVLKRVKGLPGDTIRVSFYSPSKVGRTEEEEEADEVTIKVPPGHVWVEGDNPRQSTGSSSAPPSRSLDGVTHRHLLVHAFDMQTHGCGDHCRSP
jgi:signal peptidase I